jgi:hypothetical protein
MCRLIFEAQISSKKSYKSISYPTEKKLGLHYKD